MKINNTNDIILKFLCYYKKWDSQFYMYYKNDLDFIAEIKRLVSVNHKYLLYLATNEISEIINISCSENKLLQLFEINKILIECYKYCN